MAGYGEASGGFNIKALPYVPKPAIAKRMMLSALGGWLLEDGDWKDLPGANPRFDGRGVDLTQWNHRAAMARDYYVRVVYAGYLFPFGHAASLIKVTERKFEDRAGGQGRLAVLRQRFFIIVRQKTRLYQHPNQSFQGRDLPFARIDCLTTTTPDIAKPTSDLESNPDLAREVFWPLVAGPQMPGTTNDLQYRFVGFDHAGRAIPFTSPAMFISINRNNPGKLAPIVTYYNGEAIATNVPHRRAPQFNGAVIQLAPQAGTTGDGDTNVPTEQIAFVGATATNGGVASTGGDPTPAQFFPGTDSIRVRLPAIQRLLGTNEPVEARISEAFKGADPAAGGPGFDAGANPGQVFLDLIDAAPTIAPGAPSDKGGGLVSPSILPKSLSRTLGAVGAKVAADTVGEVTEFAKGNFDPKQFIPDMKLLGVVPLSEILKIIVGLDNAPKLVNQELPDKIVASFNIHQDDLQEFPPGELALFVPNAPNDSDEKSVLDITATTVIPRPAVGAGGVTAGAATGDRRRLSHLVQGQSVRLHCHQLRQAGVQRQARIEARRHHRHQQGSRRPLQGAAGIRQRTEEVYPGERLQRSAEPRRHPRRHFGELFAGAAGDHRRRHDAAEHHHRRRLRSAFRRQGADGAVQFRRAPQPVQPDHLAPRRRRFPRHHRLDRRRPGDRGATRIRRLCRHRPRRRVGLGLHQRRLPFHLVGRQEVGGAGGVRRDRRAPVGARPDLRDHHFPRRPHLPRDFATRRATSSSARRRLPSRSRFCSSAPRSRFRSRSASPARRAIRASSISFPMPASGRRTARRLPRRG